MRILVALCVMLALIGDDLCAAHFRDGEWLAENGVLESIRIEPLIPETGEGFSVKLSGSWPEISPDGFCFPPPEIEKVVVHAGNRVQVISNLEHDASYCDQPPAHWKLDAAVPAGAWDAVDDEGFLLIEHLMSSGINMLTGINQVFDMRLGTHEVPAFLGSGFWISADRPFEGMMIEQQGSRMLFYSLGYDRDASIGDDGEPVWLMFTGDMIGNSTLGRAYRYDWPAGDGSQPEEIPTHDELNSANDSGAIIVKDYNHIRALTELSNNLALYQDYVRYTFAQDSSRSPVHVPPLQGRWTLYGFDDQSASFEAKLELPVGYSSTPNQYRFESLSGDWLVLCTMVPPATGDCGFEHTIDGIEFEFPLSAFQGNLARGNLRLENGSSLDGVLVREPWHLPVLDIYP
jgi:hypothetical protein